MRKIKPETIKDMKAEMGPARPMYPHFSISLEHLPEAKDWDISKKYTITLELKMTGKMIEERPGKDYSHSDFDIVGIEAMGKEEKSLRDKFSA